MHLLNVHVCKCIPECDWIKIICLQGGSPPLIKFTYARFLSLKARQLIIYAYCDAPFQQRRSIFCTAFMSWGQRDANQCYVWRTEFVSFEIQGNGDRGNRIHKMYRSTMFWFSGHVDNVSLYKMLFISTKTLSPFKRYIESCYCCVSFAPLYKTLETLGIFLGETVWVLLKEQSHEIVRLPNRTICETSCGCKTSLQFYLRFVGVVFAYLRSRIGSN